MSDKVRHVSGRRAVLQAFDSVIEDGDNIRIFKEAFQNEINENPIGVFKSMVMPLLPKQMEIESTTVDAAEVARQLKEIDDANAGLD